MRPDNTDDEHSRLSDAEPVWLRSARVLWLHQLANQLLDRSPVTAPLRKLSGTLHWCPFLDSVVLYGMSWFSIYLVKKSGEIFLLHRVLTHTKRKLYLFLDSSLCSIFILLRWSNTSCLTSFFSSSALPALSMIFSKKDFSFFSMSVISIFMILFVEWWKLDWLRIVWRWLCRKSVVLCSVVVVVVVGFVRRLVNILDPGLGAYEEFVLLLC